MKISPDQLKQDLAAVIDPSFAEQLVKSYTNMQQRYYAGDWQPSELDGGQFCEAVARALYQIDSGTFNDTLLPGDIAGLLRKKSPIPPHNLGEKDREHFCKVLQTAYKFRNDRGVAHVSATYTANHLDATLIIATVKWMFAEFLRLAWKRDRNEVVAIIEAIVQFDHPLIHELDGIPLILTNLLTTSEEILILLQHANGRLVRNELKESIINKTQSTVNKAINQLNTDKEVRISTAGEIVITPVGQKRLHEKIFPKLNSLNGNN
jgi:hypothetical protein